jgi:hypothetical protein
MATVTPVTSVVLGDDASGGPVGSAPAGLSSTGAERRLAESGPNEIRREQATRIDGGRIWFDVNAQVSTILVASF